MNDNDVRFFIDTCLAEVQQFIVLLLFFCCSANSFPAPHVEMQVSPWMVFEPSHAQSHLCSAVDQWLLLDVMVLWLRANVRKRMEGRKEGRKDDNKDVLDYIITHLVLGL